MEVREEAGGDGAAGFFKAVSGGVGGFRGGGTGETATNREIFGVVPALDAGGAKAPDTRGKGAADDVGVKLIEERGDVGGPGAEGTGERGDFDPEAVTLFGEGDGGNGDVEEIAKELGECCDVILAFGRAVAIEVRTGEGG